MKIRYFFPILIILASCADNSMTKEEYTQFFNEKMDSIYHYGISLSPTSQTYEGLTTNKDKWGVSNDSTEQFYYELYKSQVAYVNGFDKENLDHQAQLTHRMFIADREESIYFQENYDDYYYPVNQMFGSHTWYVSFLMNVHTITTPKDAEDWLERVQKIDVKIDETIAQLNKSTQKGIIAPKFVYPKVISDCKNLLKGTPLGEPGENALLADFKKDVDALEIEDTVKKEEFKAYAEELINTVFATSYQKLIDALQEIEEKATDQAGVWKFKNGKSFYIDKLKSTTTTDYSPDEIFEIGKAEIARIHKEMEAIKEQVGFDGTLQEFFEHTKTAEELYYPNTDEGRDAYLAKNIEIMDAMKARLDEIFITKPKAELDIRRVEPYREKSAGTAFYNSPAPDGSRPGIYYANLYDMNRMPKYEMEALSYHEAIPGHHMQLSIAQEIENLPLYRTRASRHIAYIEGWGLYAEFIPKEMGFYKDPYSDFGRLSMELFRAVRLVVDVGIHAKKWTREEGIAYYKENTPSSDGEIISMVERHIVMPSQATAYKIGQLKILELRENAKEALGDKFDIREFHEVVLTNGSVPLNILEELVDTWVASK